MTESTRHPIDTARSLGYVISGLICDTFTIACLRRSPNASLLVDFRTTNGNRMLLRLWAPMNYVGVFWSDLGHGCDPLVDVECIGYHDSCWRDSVQRFIYAHADEIDGLGLEGMRVMGVSESEQGLLKAAIKRSQGR